MYRVLLALFLPLFLVAQNKKSDSLLALLKQNIPDTQKAQILSRLGRINNLRNIPLARRYYMESSRLFEQHGDKKNAGRALAYTGLGYMNEGQYDSALINYAIADNYAAETRDTAGMIYAEMNSGTVYFITNNYNKALEVFLKSLLLAEHTGSVKDLNRGYENVGNVYKEQGKLRDALRYFLKSREYALRLNMPARIASNYINSGNVYYELALQTQKHFYLDSAYYWYSLGESTLLSDPDSSMLSMLYTNLANVFAEKKQFKQAINFYERALTIKKTIGEESQIAIIYENLASSYLEMNEPDKALPYIKTGIATAVAWNSYMDMSTLYKDYSEYYRVKNDFRNAYRYFVLHKQYADSTLNSENIERRTELEMNYAFDKEREHNLLEQREQEVLRKEEKKRSALYISITVVGLIITIIIALVIFRNLRQMKKANAIISAQKDEIQVQKELVETKQKEILDSIHYAKRIQGSLLTSEKYIGRELKKIHGKI